LCIFLYFLFDS